MYVDVRTRNVTYVERFYPQSRCMFFFSFLSTSLSFFQFILPAGRTGVGGGGKEAERFMESTYGRWKKN